MYRFFYHYYKAKGKMSVHWKNTCYVVDKVVCQVPCETKWKVRQPRLVMQGFCSGLDIRNGIATIS